MPLAWTVITLFVAFDLLAGIGRWLAKIGHHSEPLNIYWQTGGLDREINVQHAPSLEFLMLITDIHRVGFLTVVRLWSLLVVSAIIASLLTSSCIPGRGSDNDSAASGGGEVLHPTATATNEVAQITTPTLAHEARQPTSAPESTAHGDAETAEQIIARFEESATVELGSVVDPALLPVGCRSPDLVDTVLSKFADSYSTKDIDGVMALVQEQRSGVPSGLYEDAESGFITFQKFFVRIAPEEYWAPTHDDLRAQLEELFQDQHDDQLRLELVTVGALRVLGTYEPNGTDMRPQSMFFQSDRNLFGFVEFERWNSKGPLSNLIGKVWVDCEAATIIELELWEAPA